ncbi:MAG: PKD domain-containing protein, partial [Dehalococcoidia bacterium]
MNNKALTTTGIASLLLVGMLAFLFVACESPPVAKFSVTSDSGNAPFDVTFLLSEFADADSYTWDFGDGSGSTDIEPMHSFEFTGEFVVTLTAARGDVVDTAQ